MQQEISLQKRFLASEVRFALQDFWKLLLALRSIPISAETWFSIIERMPISGYVTTFMLMLYKYKPAWMFHNVQ